MLCYTLYMNRHGLEFHILTKMGISVHMADSFPLPLPKYENHAQQFAHNAFGHHHRPASFHALDFCHNQTWQLLPSPISKAISMDNEHILVPFASEARVQPQSHSFVATVQRQYDKLADTLREYLRMEEIYGMLREARIL